jgi:hypothetical protein
MKHRTPKCVTQAVALIKRARANGFTMRVEPATIYKRPAERPFAVMVLLNRTVQVGALYSSAQIIISFRGLADYRRYRSVSIFTRMDHELEGHRGMWNANYSIGSLNDAAKRYAEIYAARTLPTTSI